ncbi:polyamine ABC transporter ATP-binding protein [Candidatus Mycoplasma haematobovis]|uniref:Polyamine ABC transporter ATP-binding protein n=1 Tax=Candidatus Mycoplasma haematobovis TaxID=432608 RepID=A0A1A9QCR0_9MOLU|nr:ABC transporter ATP-binding protein [Candidatus Mycoplasma haematobovis]OAL10243.1 polyamine ABC transporter ATP-binding protein [Candidatus Mycoplasma haematobovis]
MSEKVFISLRSINKTYDRKNRVLSNFDLDIEEGSFVSILGSSGSGKSTILNLISGFIKPDSGKILLNGIDIKDIPPYHRPTATVFQDYALFPHMNVFENISFGLKKMFTNKSNVTKEVLDNTKRLHNLAIEKSNKKLEKLNVQIKYLSNKALKLKKSIRELDKESVFYKLKLWYLKSYIFRINDLDYWKSYWEYYPILQQKKLSNKYLQRPLNQKEINDRVRNIISLVGLEGKEKVKHSSLSGGQQQRVALARAIITKPKILLLDEPLSALDEEVREKLQLELKRLHKQLKITFVLITHNQKEALLLSDKIVVMRKGNVEQIGTPSELYDSPTNKWVASFMGKANIFNGVYLRPGAVLVGDKEFITDVREGFTANEKVYVMIRPEDYDVVDSSRGIVSVQVIDAIYKGQLWELRCQLFEEIIYVEAINEVMIGKTVGLVWDAMDVHVMKLDA